MKNFLYKELKLCLAPVNFVYLIFSLMVFIPNYPRYVPFYFFGVSVLYIFNNSFLNKDIEYSMILPITKKDIVKSRCILIASYEIVFILLSIPFSIIYNLFIPNKNDAGIEGNVAFYGLLLIVMSLFIFVFITSFYKKAAKPGMAFLKATLVFWPLIILLEFPIWTKDVFNIPFIQMLDQTDSLSQIKQLPILAVGLIIFISGWFLTYKISAKRFEKVDL